MSYRWRTILGRFGIIQVVQSRDGGHCRRCGKPTEHAAFWEFRIRLTRRRGR